MNSQTAELERYNRLRNAWIKKYKTFRNFDRWYGLKQAAELISRVTR